MQNNSKTKRSHLKSKAVVEERRRMRNAGFKKKSPQKGYILADRVLQDVCESVSDSDGENYDTGNNYNPRNKNSNKGRRNRRAKRTDGEKFTNMN
jgi:hypothetical protein